MMNDRSRDLRRPSAGEAPFFFDELFFSRTDDRGVILSGNTVFQRVADFDWPEMLGAPHKIIRHPDMPKAVFWLLWQTIQKGQPIGAYVKNKAKDGLHYWVYAIVTPVRGGYLSVRMKPSSELLPVVETEYAGLLALERTERLDPAKSAEALLARLKELGFPDYQAFMAHAIATEMASRCKATGTDLCESISHFRDIKTAVEQVATETQALSAVFESIRGIPYNMRILASRLEAAGGPISVISANYGVLSDEIADWMKGFAHDTDGAFAEIREAVNRGLFLQCTAMAQKEMGRQFNSEYGLETHINVAEEKALLRRQEDDYHAQSQTGMRKILEQAEKFSQAVRDMKRLITGLGATRMMCKIEGARLRNGGDSLSGVITQLDQFQDGIEQQLSRIDDLNRQIQRNAALLIEDHGETESRQGKRAKPAYSTAAE